MQKSYRQESPPSCSNQHTFWKQMIRPSPAVSSPSWPRLMKYVASIPPKKNVPGCHVTSIKMFPWFLASVATRWVTFCSNSQRLAGPILLKGSTSARFTKPRATNLRHARMEGPAALLGKSGNSPIQQYPTYIFSFPEDPIQSLWGFITTYIHPSIHLSIHLSIHIICTYTYTYTYAYIYI